MAIPSGVDSSGSPTKVSSLVPVEGDFVLWQNVDSFAKDSFDGSRSWRESASALASDFTPIEASTDPSARVNQGDISEILKLVVLLGATMARSRKEQRTGMRETEITMIYKQANDQREAADFELASACVKSAMQGIGAIGQATYSYKAQKQGIGEAPSLALSAKGQALAAGSQSLATAGGGPLDYAKNQANAHAKDLEAVQTSARYASSSDDESKSSADEFTRKALAVLSETASANYNLNSKLVQV